MACEPSFPAQKIARQPTRPRFETASERSHRGKLFVPTAGSGYKALMRIIALKSLRAHWSLPGRQDSEQPLKAWFTVVANASWSSPSEVKNQFRNASFVGERVVFNIAGNKYRLVAFINYPHHTVYVRFVGTHAEYDSVPIREV